MSHRPDTDWLWQATMYVFLGLILGAIGSGVAGIFTLSFGTVGAILSLVITGLSLFVGVYFVLRGLAVLIGAIMDGKRIES
ncbi:hypothetical protein [Haladaptatus caseinilyticus]|uniref:hypothetical protein n=1 Tax=Haladaptatus caseinilyticus TaxID=2993314 RepID=UPI00224B4A14|nr:hypothetical protein [Haladaptatus caseinilyticus]